VGTEILELTENISNYGFFKSRSTPLELIPANSEYNNNRHDLFARMFIRKCPVDIKLMT